MNKADPFEIGHAIAALNIWEKASPHNWAILSEMEEKPIIAGIALEADKRTNKLTRGHLQLFPGLEVFREFVLSVRNRDFGVIIGPIDLPHWELIATPDGQSEVFSYRPGYVPWRPEGDEAARLAPILYECWGVMMRLEENPDLPEMYKDQEAMFARKEGLDGTWRDAPYVLPPPPETLYSESVSLSRKGCELAKTFAVDPKEMWQLDFVMFPHLRTREKPARFVYALVAVNVATMERRVWCRMTVGDGEQALKKMWEEHAERVLTAILRLGRIPGEIQVCSSRMMRFLRPLGLQLPFKLVQQSKLPALKAAIDEAVKTSTL